MVKLLVRKFNGFFSDGHERTILAKKNIAISLVLKGLIVAITLLLVPMTINYVNPSQYGIWITLSTTVGLFNFFDIGLGNGLKNKLAEAAALGETKNSRIYISTTYAIISLIALALFGIFFIFNYFLDWNKIFNISPIPGTDIGLLVLIVFGSFCLQLILQVLYSVLFAFHAIAKVSVISCIGQFLCLIVIYILTKTTTGSLFYLVIALTGLPLIVQFVANIWFFRKPYAEFAPSFRFVDMKYAKNLLSVGGVFFFIQLGALLLFQTDNIVIIKLFGPEKVTVFSLTYKLFSIVNLIFTIIMNPFWAAFTDAYTKKDFDWIKNIFTKMYKYWLILVGITFLILLASPLLFKLWIGDSIQPSFLLSFGMTLYVIGTCWMMLHCFFVNGIGKLKIQFYMYIVSTIINIPLSIVFGKLMGVFGVLLSNILIVLLMDVVLYIQCKKILAGTATGFWNK